MTISVVAALGAWLVADDWLIGAAVFVIGLIWTLLRAEEGPPVLALAMTFQWVQAAIGIFYVALTGRPLEATLKSDYRPMVAIGLACVAALSVGLWCGRRWMSRARLAPGPRPEYTFSLPVLLASYGLAVAAVGGIQQIAWNYPSITQAIIALTYLRLALLYLLLRRFVRRRAWHFIAPILAFEVALGLTGFYAGFREPLIMAVLAFLETFERRNVRHWATVGALVVLMCGLGIFWVSVRKGHRERILNDEEYAQSQSRRLDSVKGELMSNWTSRDPMDLALDADRFIDRLWAVYYPALAVQRVPTVLPHTNGRLIEAAVEHLVTPRILFPDKAALGSDSELVRKYSGVWVAGEKEQTSIAFGYAAESYVDFGVPIMFVPVCIYGVLMGAAYAGLLRTIRHRELAVSVTTVIVWLSLYLFERSWVKTIGLAGTLLIYVGGLSMMLDHFLLSRSRARAAARGYVGIDLFPAESPDT
jgi:hypothetical protein